MIIKRTFSNHSFLYVIFGRKTIRKWCFSEDWQERPENDRFPAITKCMLDLDVFTI